MDLIDSIVGMSTLQSQYRVQMAVAAKVLKISQQQGDAMVAMIDSAAETMQQAIAATAGEPGRQLDVSA